MTTNYNFCTQKLYIYSTYMCRYTPIVFFIYIYLFYNTHRDDKALEKNVTLQHSTNFVIFFKL